MRKLFYGLLAVLIIPGIAVASTCTDNLMGSGVPALQAETLCASTPDTVTSAGAITATTGGVTATAGGVTATAGGVTATAGGLTVTAGDSTLGEDLYLTGRPIKTMTVTDNDAQNNTLSVAEWIGGITVHTSVTGGGTVTTDTATNMVAGSGGTGALSANDQCTTHYYVNDGDQTLTLAGGTGVTVADTGNTILINEAAILIFCRDSATTGTLYTVSS